MGFAEIDENAKRGSKCCKSALEPCQVTTGKECFCVICMRRCLGDGAKTALRAGCRCLQRPGRLDKIAWHFKRRVLHHRLPRVCVGSAVLGRGPNVVVEFVESPLSQFCNSHGEEHCNRFCGLVVFVRWQVVKDEECAPKRSWWAGALRGWIVVTTVASG